MGAIQGYYYKPNGPAKTHGSFYVMPNDTKKLQTLRGGKKVEKTLRIN